MLYINYKDSVEQGCIDTAETMPEAKALLKEYKASDKTATYWISNTEAQDTFLAIKETQ